MTNRLRLPWQLRLFLIACLFPWTISLNAQCECGAPTNNGATQVCSGDLFTLTYSGPDTILVGSSCTGVLTTGIASSVAFMPAPATTVQSISGGYAEGDNVPAGSIVTYQYIVSDNTTFDTLCFNIEFVDDIAPVLNTTIPDTTVNCEVSDFTQWWNDQIDSLTMYSTDNCTIDTIFHSQTASLFDNCGTFIDTFFVVDTFGNTTFTTATYSIFDNVAPFFTNFPANETLSCDASIPAVATNVTADDNCAAIATPVYLGADTVQIGGGACANYNYEIRRTWRVTDGCGNTTDSTQIIAVDDTTSPTFDMPADVTIACGMSTDTSATGNITNVLDNCSNDLTITMSQVTVGGSCPQEMTITRTWQVTDECGNSLSKSQMIVVEDTEDPVASFPADITVACFDDTDDSATGVPTNVSDNCQTSPTVSRVDIITAGPCEHTFSVDRTWTVEDACGNSISQIQQITVKDTIAPVVNNEAVNQTITCDVDIATAFTNWIDMHGAASATDNCVVPGDSLTWNAFIAGTSIVASLPGPDCLNPTTGIFTQVTIDFVVYDKCDNRDTTTAVFTVADNDPPVIVNCPTDVTVDVDAGQCDRMQTLLLPVVMENCGNATVPVNLSISQTPTIPTGSNPVETPIDDLVYNFNVNGPPYSVLGNATLTIQVENLDAEQPTEYLEVYGENGALLGTVPNTAVQCGDTLTTFTIAANLIDAWAFDGILTITVKPNIPSSLSGIFAVNPICPNNEVTAMLSYTSNFPAGLGFDYTINSGSRTNVFPLAPFNEVLEQGVNTINYYFSDCAGNETNCTYNVTVQDNESPEIICPPNETLDLDAGTCSKEVIVPLFTNVTDNCGVTTPSTQTQPADSLTSLITFSYNPNLGDYVADDKTFTFSGLQGNATPGGVKLIIEIQGDVDSVGEYFRIIANGLDLGTTANNQPNVIAGNCTSSSFATFMIPATTFNEWTAQGDIVVEALSFTGFPIPPAGPTWGINPCDAAQVSSNGDTDGSYIKATFSYESVTPTFSAAGGTIISPTVLTPPLEADTFLLVQGTTTFTYSVTDLNGNTGDCSFDIIVQDTEAPTALCGPAFVDINPSGFDVDTVYANEIDLGSMDNCSIESMTVSPSVFDCGDQGTNPVTLTVIDSSGNVSVCSTFVNVTTQQPVPSANSICGTNQLQLFANPPASSGGGNVIYNYTWLNPSGLAFAFVENPIIQDADLNDVGFYTVIIEGVTFCESMASVQVTCDMLPLQQPLLQTAGNNICANEVVELSTTAVCGTNVTYEWYVGSAPGVLMGTTTEPNYSMAPPSSGTYNFYVIVERSGCDSELSDQITVQVNPAPVATVANTNMLICENDQIILESINVPQGATCHWTGPCGYESFICNPGPINNVEACNGGIYELVVINNGCPSVPDTTFINVVPLPETPFISNTTSSNNPACNGDPVTLTSTVVPGALSYEWTNPMFTNIITTDNVLTIQNADINKDAGSWTVKVNGNSCESIVSTPTVVHITNLPEAVTSSVTPGAVCEGQEVQLSASSSTPNVNYSWVFPNNQTSAMQNPVLTDVSGQNSGMYDLTVTTEFGCTVSESIELEVLERVDITSVSNNSPDCVNGPVNVQLIATLFPIDNGNYQYLWEGPNGYSSTDPSAIIPGAISGDDNGPYTLMVTNEDGCVSLPATVNVEIPSILPTPVLETIAPHCVGESVTLTASPFNGSNATYFWTVPGTGAGLTTTGPSLTLPSLDLDDAGSYFVNYVVDGCNSAISGEVMLEVNPIPLITPSSNSPVCEGASIELNIDCSAGAVYEWFGPGFGAAACNPIINNADPSIHNGAYSVRKQVDGCWSEVEVLNVEVKEKPDRPTAINTGPFCADTDNVVLSVTTGTSTVGATYSWFDENGEPVGSSTPALNYSIPNPNVLGQGDFQFQVIANLDGCESDASFFTDVHLDTIPANIAEAGPHIDACEGEEVFLAGTLPSVGTGLWNSSTGNPGGITIFNPDEAGTEIEGLITGETYTFEWTLSNGACADYSTDETTVFVNMLEDAVTPGIIDVCNETVVTLEGNAPVSNTGEWTQPLSQEMLGVVIVEPGNPASQVTGIEPGNDYIFTWTIDGGCGSSSDVLIVSVDVNEIAFAGIDQEDCGDGSTLLQATQTTNSDGTWTSPDAAIQFVADTDPLTTAINLSEGENTLIWTIENEACGATADTVVIDYQLAPMGVDDINNNVGFAGSYSLDVVDNDLFLTDFFSIAIVNGPFNGEANVSNDGQLDYQADVNFIGMDSLEYEVCVQDCECTRATVQLMVGGNAACMAPSIITPNEDGMNDAFVVPCLAEVGTDGMPGFPDNVLKIYNQWGDQVYHAEPYNNDWRGTFNGDDLPAGTYFYIIDLGNGEDAMSGYLIIQR